MEEEQIRLALQILPVLTAGFSMGLFLALTLRIRGDAVLLENYEVLAGFLAERGRSTTWYQRMKERLTKNGAAFHFGRRISPPVFLLLQIVPAALGFGAAFAFHPLAAVLAAAVLCQAPGLLLWYENRRDNERMLPEIKMVYHALEIEIRAGIHLTDALSECYGSVRNPRLKQAFLELAGDIVMKADIYEALDHFQRSFDNRYIDALCITILQALESGQAVDLLGDIAEQIKDMEAGLLGRKKGALDRRMTFYQLGILTAVLGVTLWAVIQDMFQMAAAL